MSFLKILRLFVSSRRDQIGKFGGPRGGAALLVAAGVLAGLGPAAFADGYLIVPWVQAAAVSPETIEGGDDFHLIAKVIDLGGGIGRVDLDLSALGGSDRQVLYDDGDPAHGDRFAGDGIYNLITRVPVDWMPGGYDLVVRGYGVPDGEYTSATCRLTVLGGTPLIHVTDPPGDDHGPSQEGVSHLYYTYPTNSCFVPGAFDLRDLTVRRVLVNLGGGIEERLAFQVGVGEFPDPSQPGSIDWGALYAGLNLQKIDILIDTGPGGATASLPGRGAGYQTWNGWEFAIVIDGWYKAVVPSLGSNDVAAWKNNALVTDADIVLVGNFAADTITALVSPACLGYPTDGDIGRWNICVQLSGHDAGGADVFGGTRSVQWVSTEWRFGGGSDSERDANLMDLLLAPGTGFVPGRPQEYLLDYESPEALDRWARGLIPVMIEMSAGEVAGDPAVTRAGPRLGQNEPNPFNPSTVIPFALPAGQEVRLAVFDLAGRRVRTLIAGDVFAAGPHRAGWDGRDGAGNPVAAGTYFYRFQAGGVTVAKRMTLLK